MNTEDTKTCPYCAETIRSEAIKCRYCGSHVTTPPATREWFRDTVNGKIGGVCAGLAQQFSIPATPLRLAFIIGTFIGGWGLLIYLVLWIIMPPRRSPPHPTSS